MREKILQIVEQSPKKYSQIIANDQELRDWVKQHSLIESDQWNKMIYSAVHAVSDVCEHGNIRKLSRWSQGFTGCGPAAQCPCTAAKLAKSVARAKAAVSDLQQSQTNAARAATMLAKYGVEYNSQRPEVKEKISLPKIPKAAWEKLCNQQWLHEEYVVAARSAVDIAAELGVYYGTVIEYCRQHGFKIKQRSNYSLVETEIHKYIESLGVRCETSDWEILQDREIDILIPDHGLGIEVNGLYWHSYSPKNMQVEDRHRHANKTRDAAVRGVELIHITDWEWRNQQSIIKSMLQAKLNANRRVHARKTQLAQLTTQQARDFFNRHHLQGFIGAQHHYGLYDQDVLVMAVSVGRSRFDQNHAWELYRLCSAPGITVVGGGSRLMHHLRNLVEGPIVTYCDLSKSSGRGYLAMGFTSTHVTGPGFFWTDGTDVVSRYRCQKHRLSSWLRTYDPDKSQVANMWDNNYRRYWDCGNLVLTYQ